MKHQCVELDLFVYMYLYMCRSLTLLMRVQELVFEDVIKKKPKGGVSHLSHSDHDI